MAGLTPYIDQTIFNELSKRVTVEGGRVLATPHAGVKLAYPDASDDKNREIAEKGAKTCSCGESRKLSIPYSREVEFGDGTKQDVVKNYIACANCDAVALQPRWFTGRWAA